MIYTALAFALKQHLGLAHEPVALAAMASKPAVVGVGPRLPTSACALWREAERGLFYGSADSHGGCSVGAYVMRLPMSPLMAGNLTDSIRMMGEVDYLPESEVGSIPRMQRESDGVLYGPLKDFVEQPDCVIVWTSAVQAMILNEALGTASWDQQRDASKGLKLLGRPACGAVAHACGTKGPVLSLGCSGMRLFTEIDSGLSLFVIPGSALDGLPERLAKAAETNDQMLVEYRRKKSAMAVA